jgi:hypothetical protein
MAIVLRNSIFSQISKPTQKEAFSMILVSALVVILLGVFVLRPAISSAIQQISNNNLKVELIKRQESKLDTLEYLNEQITLYDGEIALLDQSLAEDYFTEFFALNFHLEFVNSPSVMLREIRFEQDLFSADSASKNEVVGYTSILGTLIFSSDYDGLISMIEYIETFPRILNIRKIDLSPMVSDLPLSVKIEVEYLIRSE